MSGEHDAVSLYAQALGITVQSRTIIVEGTTDVALFTLAATLERASSGTNLLDGLAIVASGEGDAGGTTGVIRELVTFRGIARTVLQANGLPKYRFVALFDNDRAGKYAVKSLQGIDRSIIECKDVFRLRPVMPLATNLDPTSLCAAIETHNATWRGLDWEAEDLVSKGVVEKFLGNCPDAITKVAETGGYLHREFTRDGKAKFHRFVKTHCLHQDILAVIAVLKAMRCYLGLK